MTSQNTESIYFALSEAAKKWPNRDLINVLETTAEIYKIRPEKLSYNRAIQKIELLADKFRSAGFQRGMRIAILLENRPDFFLFWMAFNKLGISVVPINPDLRLMEIEYLVEHSEPSLIISIEARHLELKKAVAKAKLDIDIIGPNSAPNSPRPNSIVAKIVSKEKLREAALLYTSGTTGKPKGCVLSNNYFLNAGEWYANIGGFAKLSLDGERMITPLPLFHMNAIAYSFMAMIAVGGCLTVLDRFHPTTWWADVREAKATIIHYLGIMPSLLMATANKDSDTKHDVRFGFGAGVDPKLHSKFEERFGFPLIEAWAMTETGAGAVIADNGWNRTTGRSCLGIPSKKMECKIVDEFGNCVPCGQPGELLVRSAKKHPKSGFFSYYYKDPEATAESWRGGWFHTGDLVRKNNAGEIFFVDRKKNIIRRSGENIAAIEVESILMKHSEIKAAAVTAVNDELRGDEVFAFLMTHDQTQEKAFEIISWCLSQMAYYKVPGYVAFVEKIPLTSTQKIQRSELKELAKKLLLENSVINTIHLKKRTLA